MRAECPRVGRLTNQNEKAILSWMAQAGMACWY